MLPNEITLNKKYKHVLSLDSIAVQKEIRRRISFSYNVNLPVDLDFNATNLNVVISNYINETKSYQGYTNHSDIKEITSPLIGGFSFDITNNLEWEKGDFKDDKSCFWGDRKSHRYSLQNYGCRAIRFYKGKKGIGRAWAWPYKRNGLVLFNSYGLPLITMAVVASDFFGLPCCPIKLASNEIYINSQSNIGFDRNAILIMEDCKEHLRIELAVKKSRKCADCDKVFPESNLAVLTLNDRSEPKGLCKKCKSKRKGEICPSCLSSKMSGGENIVYRRRRIHYECDDCNFLLKKCCYCNKRASDGYASSRGCTGKEYDYQEACSNCYYK